MMIRLSFIFKRIERARDYDRLQIFVLRVVGKESVIVDFCNERSNASSIRVVAYHQTNSLSSSSHFN